MGWGALINLVLEIGLAIFKMFAKNQQEKEERAKRFLEYLEKWDRSGKALAKYRDDDEILKRKLRR